MLQKKALICRSLERRDFINSLRLPRFEQPTLVHRLHWCFSTSRGG